MAVFVYRFPNEPEEWFKFPLCQLTKDVMRSSSLLYDGQKCVPLFCRICDLSSHVRGNSSEETSELQEQLQAARRRENLAVLRLAVKEKQLREVMVSKHRLLLCGFIVSGNFFFFFCILWISAKIFLQQKSQFDCLLKSIVKSEVALLYWKTGKLHLIGSFVKTFEIESWISHLNLLTLLSGYAIWYFLCFMSKWIAVLRSILICICKCIASVQ